MNVLWFSRVAPTAEQAADLAAQGCQIVAIDEGMALASKSIGTPEELGSTVKGIEELAEKNSAMAVYGVFPTPIQSVIADRTSENTGVGLGCYESWCVSPFTHQKFLWVGIL
jgi:hypothetical protein